jgi:cytochrome c5
MNKHVTEFENAMNARRNKAADATVAHAEQATQAQLTGDRFLGEQNCRRCHEVEFQKIASHPHAHALETLTKNQRDATPECLPLPRRGHGSARRVRVEARDAAVGERAMRELPWHGDAASDGGSDRRTDVCMKCHTHEQNPDFQYDVMVAKIVHWN